MALRMLHNRGSNLLGSRSRRDRSEEADAANANVDVEMQTPVPPANDAADADETATQRTGATQEEAGPSGTAGEQQRGGFSRAGVSRAVMNTIYERVTAMREAERRSNYMGGFSSAHIPSMRDVEAAAEAIRAADANEGNQSRAGRKDAKSRREREEASALIGPNLAQYFGSGSSTSGAVAANTVASALRSDANASAPGPAAGTENVPPDTPGGLSSSARRRPRLGSRGRVRGASLSGLSSFNLSGQGDSGDGGLETPGLFNRPLGSPEAGTADRSASDEEAELQKLSEQVALAEGIDITVLKDWIAKSLANGGPVELQEGTATEAEDHAAQLSESCTTLQSYVNLKRNTIRLMATTSNIAYAATAANESSAGDTKSSGLEDAKVSHPLSEDAAPQVHQSEMRPARSLSTMPSFAGSLGNATSSSSLVGEAATHELHFEYDCSAPSASIQLFVRASRKHGSWSSWTAKRESAGLDPRGGGAADALWFTSGPPPHVLGWPVQSSVVRKAFAQPSKTGLSLRLGLYSPPSSKGNSAGAASMRKSERSKTDRAVDGEGAS